MKKRTTERLLIVLWWSTILSVGCSAGGDNGSGGGSAETGASPGQGCVPGMSVPCTCQSGGKGVAICRTDGSGYSQCACPQTVGDGELSLGDSWQPWQQDEPVGGAGGAAGAAGGAAVEAGTGGAAGAAGSAGGAVDAGDEIAVMDGGGVYDGGSITPQSDSGTVTPNPDQDEVPMTAYCAPVSNWDPGWVAWEEEVLQLVNERRAAGADCGSEGTFGPAGPLTMNPELRCSARLHSKDMAENSYFNHISPDGRTPSDRMTDAGYLGGMQGENIASGQISSPQDVMNGWMGSDGHCANIMQAGFTEIGVGYYEIAGGGWWDTFGFWTQNFGNPGWGGW